LEHRQSEKRLRSSASVEAATFTSAHQQVLLETQQAKPAPQASQVFLTDAPLIDRALD
jgi:hypothetical protein